MITETQPAMSLRYWIQRAEQALNRNSTRMAQLYMRRALTEHENAT